MLIVLAKIPEREWSISPSTFYGQLPDYQSRMLALSTQQMSSSCCWCKSKELGGRGSPRFSCVTPVVKKFSSDFLRAIIPTFRILSDIHSGALLRKQSTALTCSLFPQKSFIADVRLDFKCASDWRYCKCELQLDCKCMEFVTTGWCSGKQLRLWIYL